MVEEIRGRAGSDFPGADLPGRELPGREPRPPLSSAQFERYRRHLSLPQFGLEGQERLLAGRVLVLGAGGLGSPLVLYLTAAGVGHIGLVDFDTVAVSNLQRQVLYTTDDLARAKTEVARERLQALNPEVEIRTHPVRLDAQNALSLFADYDVIVDGTDNFPARYAANDACVQLGRANVYGAILRYEGQATVFDARRGPCYRCLFPVPPPPGAVPSCAEGGVLGVLPGLIALIQATETLKLLAGFGETLLGRLLQYDALTMRFVEFQLRKDPDCPACGAAAMHSGFPAAESARSPAGDTQEEDLTEVRAVDVARRRERGERFLLLDVREPEEYRTAHIEGAQLIPLGELEQRIAELSPWRTAPVVVHCHTGVRSARAVRQLRAQGFRDVANLDGGIDAWSLTVDPRVARYGSAVPQRTDKETES